MSFLSIRPILFVFLSFFYSPFEGTKVMQGNGKSRSLFPPSKLDR